MTYHPPLLRKSEWRKEPVLKAEMVGRKSKGKASIMSLRETTSIDIGDASDLQIEIHSGTITCTNQMLPLQSDRFDSQIFLSITWQLLHFVVGVQLLKKSSCLLQHSLKFTTPAKSKV